MQNMLYLYDGVIFGHKRSAVLLHATIYINLENTRLREKFSQRNTYCIMKWPE